MTAALITTPFAQDGDKTPIPETDPAGFVNLSEGYTKYYEINLQSGDPQAKAVERAIQNYLFNLLCSNQKMWQMWGFSDWYPNSGGYQQNAMVMRKNAQGSGVPYRCIALGTNADPLTTPADWEYIRTWAEISAKIPMMAGGATGAELITAAVDENAIATGTYEVATDAIAQSMAMPISPFDTVARAGMLECKRWVGGGGAVAIQRYTDRMGVEYARGLTAATWTPWIAQSSISAQGDVISYAQDTSTVVNQLDISSTLQPPLTVRKEGMVIKVRANGIASSNNTGPVTIKDGLGVAAVVGKTAALQGGEFTANSEIWLQWSPFIGVAPGSYVVMSNSGPASQTGTGTKTQHAATVGQLGLRGLSSIALSGNFTVPASVYVLDVQVWGGGGGAGGSGTGGGSAGGGGGGGYCRKRVTVTPGQVIACVVGGGGPAGAPGGDGGPGVASTFGAGAGLMTAFGGGAGAANPSGNGGAGGIGQGGDVNMSGSGGGSGSNLNVQGGPGGGSPAGGAGSGGAQGNASAGGFPGGGGGGGGPGGYGGSGNAGLIVVSW